MGDLLYNRDVLLNIGGLKIASRSPDGKSRPLLRVTFKVVRDMQGHPNSAQISIWNLREANRTLVQKKNALTVLEAGYVDNRDTIFTGDLDFGSNEKQNVDWVTTLRSEDGGKAFRSARVSKNLKGPVTIAKVLKEAAKALGLGLGNTDEKAAKGSIRKGIKNFAKGYVLSGKATDELDKVAKAAGYQWTIQDKQIRFFEKNETLKGKAFVISAETGMIGSPQAGEDGIIKVKSLLNPQLIPGRKIELIAQQEFGSIYRSFYRIQKVVFTGDTWGTDWYADMEAKPIPI